MYVGKAAHGGSPVLGRDSIPLRGSVDGEVSAYLFFSIWIVTSKAPVLSP